MDAAEVAAIQAWATDHPVVFVCGLTRSGTTRLQAVFQSCPTFARADGRVLESTVMRNLRQLRQWRTSPELVRYLAVPDGSRCPLDDAIEASARWPDAWATPFLIRAFYRTAAATQGVTRLADKSPGIESHAATLKLCFPRARFVYLLRHPLDVYGSMRAVLERQAAAGVAETELAWWRMAPETFAETWSASVAAAFVMHQAMPGEVSSVRYEDFVARPEAIVRGLFDALGEPFDPIYLEAGPSSAAWGDWEPHLRKPIAPTGQDWRTRVTPAEARLIQQRLAEPMAATGYAPHPA